MKPLPDKENRTSKTVYQKTRLSFRFAWELFVCFALIIPSEREIFAVFRCAYDIGRENERGFLGKIEVLKGNRMCAIIFKL